MLISSVHRIFISVLLFFTGVYTSGFSQFTRYTEDTAKVSFGLYAKAGMVYDYPFFKNYSDLSPIGELGTNIIFEKLQIGVGLGFFANNSHWQQGADLNNPGKTGTTQGGNFYIPLHADFKLFNIKRNLLSLKLGFMFLFSTPVLYSETTVNGTLSYPINQTRFGLGGTLGFKYSRHIGERILLGAELCLNLSLTPAPAMLLGTDYVYGFNMAARQPNGDFKICFEYILGKKHVNYLNLSTRKKPKVDRRVILDEE